MGAMAAQAWHSLQAAAESVVVRLVAKGAGDIVDRARALPWLPDQPPRNAAAHSAYIAELLAYLKVLTAAHVGCHRAVPMAGTSAE